MLTGFPLYTIIILVFQFIVSLEQDYFLLCQMCVFCASFQLLLSPSSLYHIVICVHMSVIENHIESIHCVHLTYCNMINTCWVINISITLVTYHFILCLVTFRYIMWYYCNHSMSFKSPERVHFLTGMKSSTNSQRLTGIRGKKF